MSILLPVKHASTYGCLLLAPYSLHNPVLSFSLSLSLFTRYSYTHCQIMPANALSLGSAGLSPLMTTSHANLRNVKPFNTSSGEGGVSGGHRPRIVRNHTRRSEDHAVARSRSRCTISFCADPPSPRPHRRARHR